MAEYKVAMYIRLSDSDEEMGKKKDESNSVVHQRMLIRNYLDNNKEFEACLKEEFVDDGFSGTNMIRGNILRRCRHWDIGEIQKTSTG